VNFLDAAVDLTVSGLLELILIKKRKMFPLKWNLTPCPESLNAEESFSVARAHFLWFSFKRI
jgi:hypothetical protein